MTRNYIPAELDADDRISSHYRFTVKSRADETLLALRKNVKKRNKVRGKRYVKLHGKNSAGSYVNRLKDAVEFDVYVYGR